MEIDPKFRSSFTPSKGRHFRLPHDDGAQINESPDILGSASVWAISLQKCSNIEGGFDAREMKQIFQGNSGTRKWMRCRWLAVQTTGNCDCFPVTIGRYRIQDMKTDDELLSIKQEILGRTRITYPYGSSASGTTVV